MSSKASRELQSHKSSKGDACSPFGNEGVEEQFETVEVMKEPTFDPSRQSYRVAATVFSAIAVLTSVGSIITAGIMWQQAYDYTGGDSDRVLYAALYIFTLVESCLSFIATLVYFSELIYRPNEVLLRHRDHSKLVGRCITVFLLVLTAIYSFCVPLVLRNHEPKTSAALCVVPGVRFIAMICFFAVLVADSRA